MSSESRLKRFGLWHLRDKPEELMAELDRQIEEYETKVGKRKPKEQEQNQKPPTITVDEFRDLPIPIPTLIPAKSSREKPQQPSEKQVTKLDFNGFRDLLRRSEPGTLTVRAPDGRTWKM